MRLCTVDLLGLTSLDQQLLIVQSLAMAYFVPPSLVWSENYIEFRLIWGEKWPTDAKISSKLNLKAQNIHIKTQILYFIKYNGHTSIVRTWISQWFLAKKLFYFSRIISQELNHCKSIHHKNHLKPFLSYLPCIASREYFSIIFNIKKRTLYSIKYYT